MKSTRRIGRVLSITRVPSKLNPKNANIVITFELHNKKKVRLFCAELYPWSLLRLCKKAGLHLHKGVYNTQRLIDKKVWLRLTPHYSFGGPSYTRVEIW